jgi:hypothetical protein
MTARACAARIIASARVIYSVLPIPCASVLASRRPGKISVVFSVTLGNAPGSHLAPAPSSNPAIGLTWPVSAGGIFWRLLLRERREKGVMMTSMRNRSGRMFHMMEIRIISTSEVATPCPRTRQDLPTPASPAPEGASLKTRSEYRAMNRSSAASNVLKKFSEEPDSAWLTAARLVPQEEQNFRSLGFSLPQIGQNIRLSPQGAMGGHGGAATEGRPYRFSRVEPDTTRDLRRANAAGSPLDPELYHGMQSAWVPIPLA